MRSKLEDHVNYSFFIIYLFFPVVIKSLMKSVINKTIMKLKVVPVQTHLFVRFANKHILKTCTKHA